MMNLSNRTSVVAVFATRGQAEIAIDQLWHAGFKENQIGIVAPGKGVVEADTATGNQERKAGAGAAKGAIAGGSLGAILGAVVTGLIPGVGPMLAGGILAGVLTGAAAGAAGGSYLGPFLAMGVSDEEARAYQEHFQAGRTVVAVQTPDRQAEAITILHSNGGKVESPTAAGVSA